MGSMLPFQETPEAESMDPTQGKACDAPWEHRLQSHPGKATYFPSTGPGGLMAQFGSVKGSQPGMVIARGCPCTDLFGSVKGSQSGMVIARGCPCTDLNAKDPQNDAVMVARWAQMGLSVLGSQLGASQQTSKGSRPGLTSQLIEMWRAVVELVL